MQRPEHFIERLVAVKSQSATQQTLAVFLTTPSFAPWLLDDRVFLEKALQKLYQDIPSLSGETPTIRAICAVVDRLPEAQLVGNGSESKPLLEEFAYRARQPPVSETGHEGIAYVVLPAGAEVSAQPKLSGEFGCIDFLAHTHTDSPGSHYSRVRVPLANTVFQTGEPSTLISSTWKWSESDGRFNVVSRDVGKTAVVNLSAEIESSKKASIESHLHREAPALSVPLVPLTVPRQVEGYMGNIIRGVVGPDGVKITASTELERVVPHYFKSRNEPAQATSAWALVIPKTQVQLSAEDTTRLIFNRLDTDPESLSPEDFETWSQKGFEALWQQHPPRWNVMVQEALMRGARLHKVLSGGGGWGKKAGLLSLDPMPVGAPARKAPLQDGMADDFDSVDEFSMALKPVIQDGDFIQFFISAAPAQGTDDAAAFQRLKQLEKNADSGAWSWEFGVIPSTVDSIPGGSWQHTGEASGDLAVFRGSFGALSEGGLTLMHGLSIDSKTGAAEKDINTTMVDVPFSRWSAVRLNSKDAASRKVNDSSKSAEEVKLQTSGDSTHGVNAGIPS